MENKHRVDLAGDLRVRSLPDIRSRLLSLEASHLEIDLGGVTEFDTAGLQLLLSLRKELNSRAGSLVITGASESVRNLVTFFGVHDLLAVSEA